MKVDGSVFGMPERGLIRLQEIASFEKTKLYAEPYLNTGWSALHTAVFKGNTPEIRRLLSSRPCVDAPTKETVYVVQVEINPTRPSEKITTYNLFEKGTSLFNINPNNLLIRDLLLRYNIEPMCSESIEMTPIIS